jgi:hypothetical protein
MDRYQILLNKKLEPQKGFWEASNEHAWNYRDRLRLIVTGGAGDGKTSYLIYDAIKISQLGRFIFVCPSHYLDHVKGMLSKFKTHFNHSEFDLCTWEEFVERTSSLRGARTIYFDDADHYEHNDALGQRKDLYGIGSLMAYANGRLANFPRIIITCSRNSIDSSMPVPKGNWDWKHEDLVSWKAGHQSFWSNKLKGE